MDFLKIRHLSKGSLLKLRYTTKFITDNRELTLKLFSNRQNTSYYNRLDKEVADFKEHKGGPVIPHTTKCIYHQNGEDTDDDKRCKTYT